MCLAFPAEKCCKRGQYDRLQISVIGLPWCPIPGRDGTEIKSHVKMMSEFGDGLQHSDELAPRIHKVRAVKFLKEDIAKYGVVKAALHRVAVLQPSAIRMPVGLELSD